MATIGKYNTRPPRSVNGIRISRQYVIRISIFALVLLAFFLTALLPVSLRLEMVVKVVLLSFAAASLPKMDLGALGQALALALALITVYLFGFGIENKALSRSIIVLILIPAIFRVEPGLWFYLLAAVVMWIIQELTNSRGLQLTVILFLAQLLLSKWGKPLVLLWLTPTLYIVGMAVLGGLYIAGINFLPPTASNLARSSMIFIIVTNIFQFPFGYSDELQYFSHLSILAFNLYSDTYNDPHNFYLTAAVWGGIPALFLSVWSTGALLRTTSSNGKVRPVVIFANSSLVVSLSTSTLSLSNAVFFLLMFVFVTLYSKETNMRMVKILPATSFRRRIK